MTAALLLLVLVLLARNTWSYVALRRSEALDVAEWLARKGIADEPVSEAVERIGHLSIAEITTQREEFHYGRGYDAAIADEHERRSRAARRAAATRRAT